MRQGKDEKLLAKILEELRELGGLSDETSEILKQRCIGNVNYEDFKDEIHLFYHKKSVE